MFGNVCSSYTHLIWLLWKLLQIFRIVRCPFCCTYFVSLIESNVIKIHFPCVFYESCSWPLFYLCKTFIPRMCFLYFKSSQTDKIPMGLPYGALRDGTSTFIYFRIGNINSEYLIPTLWRTPSRKLNNK